MDSCKSKKDKYNNNVENVRYIVKIYGLVQGIGFRPFIFNMAQKFKIHGYVKNIGGAVLIDCEGKKEDIKQFILSIAKNPIELAHIEKIECTFMKDNSKFKFQHTIEDFVIKESSAEINEMRFVLTDIATCPKCLEDIQNKKSCRYKYAFTNCTNCGPRYSIIKALPYDRKNTTMESFHMCEKCKEEYEDNINRRFHAETNCCAECGPKLHLLDNSGKEIVSENVIDMAIKLIGEGKILAVKGIGGFHLVCNGENEKAIQLLRDRKHRKHKPLALMAKDINVIKEICYVSPKEESLLTSNKRPIVILKKKYSSQISEFIAPKQNSLGIMLPYTPLHTMLLKGNLGLLVMTSGNVSRMSMEYKNENAINHLCKVADYFLVHDREIYIEEDDSVVKVINGVERVIRRGRGYAPFNIRVNSKKQIEAVGSQQKNTICISKNGYGYLSQYLGDLEEKSCYDNFQHVLNHLLTILKISPEILVHDMHPSFISTKYATAQDLRKIKVQHHHAHMVSCMVEYNIHETVIGIIFDGTGFGLDGAIWGGEFLIGNRAEFKRVGHLEYVKIQGGNQAIKEPWRCAESYLNALNLEAPDMLQDIVKEKKEIVKQALKNNINCFISSSIGRLFDAVAVLCGIRNNITYDGQAAIELENIIDEKVQERYSYVIIEENDVFKIQYKAIIEGIIKDLRIKEPISRIAAKFHNSIIEASCELACKLREKEKIDKVILSGGVFENEYLLKNLYKKLMEKKFMVFYNAQIPTNDEGISFGQLQVASAILENEKKIKNSGIL